MSGVSCRPSSGADGRRGRGWAVLMLTLAPACWAVSFPIMRALQLLQPDLAPGCSSWFFSGAGVAYRFGLAGVLMAFWCLLGAGAPTRREIEQGVVLGLWSSAGMVLQMDGLAYTHASISAFLTQGYAIFIPLWQALRRRRLPSLRLLLAAAAVLAGVGVLSGMTLRDLRMGRGELETLAAAVMFTGQILWLEHPRYAGNDFRRFSTAMFFVMALFGAGIGFWACPRPEAWARIYAGAAPLAMLALLVVVCTLGGYLLMNRWQREVSAAEAGLIYCAEPVFASLWAMWLPGLLAGWAGVAYANETVTWRLAVGGGLILAANVWVQLSPEPEELPSPIPEPH